MRAHNEGLMKHKIKFPWTNLFKTNCVCVCTGLSLYKYIWQVVRILLLWSIVNVLFLFREMVYLFLFCQWKTKAICNSSIDLNPLFLFDIVVLGSWFSWSVTHISIDHMYDLECCWEYAGGCIYYGRTLLFEVAGKEAGLVVMLTIWERGREIRGTTLGGRSHIAFCE